MFLAEINSILCFLMPLYRPQTEYNEDIITRFTNDIEKNIYNKLKELTYRKI